ncbi:unnamed protein product, partial [Discosporangium mesarthrocarpum]
SQVDPRDRGDLCPSRVPEFSRVIASLPWSHFWQDLDARSVTGDTQQAIRPRCVRNSGSPPPALLVDRELESGGRGVEKQGTRGFLEDGCKLFAGEGSDSNRSGVEDGGNRPKARTHSPWD